MSESQMKGWTMPLPTFEAVRFIPPKQEQSIRNSVVQKVLVVAHDIIKSGKGGNHWCFYLSIGPNHSVRIDPTPSGLAGPTLKGGSKAYIVISDLSYDYSHQAQYLDTLTVPGNISVGQFIDAITQRGRHKYEFDSDGRGCRFWTHDQIDLFLSLKLLAARSECEKAKDNILQEFENFKPTKRKVPLNKGAYYDQQEEDTPEAVALAAKTLEEEKKPPEKIDS